MYIKIIGSLFLISSAAAIGFLKSEELNERVKLLEELKRMMVLLQGELRFHRAELSEAFENIAERVEEPFAAFLKGTAAQLEKREKGGLEVVWRDNLQQLLKEDGFQRSDVELLELLGNSLGYLDLTMQTEHLNLTILRTEEVIGQAKNQQEKKGKLYQTMGITAGALLTLLII